MQRILEGNGRPDSGIYYGGDYLPDHFRHTNTPVTPYMWLSRNASFVILTKASHLVVVGYLFHVASHNHIFRCSAYVPDKPPALPVLRPCTASAISSFLGRTSWIAAVWTRIGVGLPSGVRLL